MVEIETEINKKKCFAFIYNHRARTKVNNIIYAVHKCYINVYILHYRSNVKMFFFFTFSRINAICIVII